jgi:DNA-binding NarL/FixJ family response regulator
MAHPHEYQHFISVVVAEATTMACELLANTLSNNQEMQVVGWELDSGAALGTMTKIAPQVALISSDLQDGPGKGLSLASALRLKRPEVRSVILMDNVDRRSAIDAFRAGARGVLSRNAGLAVLPKCVRRVSEGQIWASSKELAYLLDTFASTNPGRTLSDNCRKLLTEREQQVVQLVADGLGNREIAARLHLSPHTVKNYLFQVFDKIGVSSRVELVLCALTNPNSDAMAERQADQKHGVSVAARRRPDSMTNA